ncbi:hypothetical protein ABRZ03_02240 [Castellaniella ginsengisoli]|uniref:Uncharacterized protein n=1 Tax=Castellaniella ginsengisoli TaxID=546114 RepID=A0AB39EB42_9BURK
MKYEPPSAEQMRKIKDAVGATAKKMAQRTCVTEQHWRKFTASTVPRGIPYEKLFHFAALETLSEDQVNAIHRYMVRIGATIEADELNDPELLSLRVKAQEAADKHQSIIDLQTDLLRRYPPKAPIPETAANELNRLAEEAQQAINSYRVLSEQYYQAGGGHPFYVESRHHRR